MSQEKCTIARWRAVDKWTVRTNHRMKAPAARPILYARLEQRHEDRDMQRRSTGSRDTPNSLSVRLGARMPSPSPMKEGMQLSLSRGSDSCRAKIAGSDMSPARAAT